MRKQFLIFGVALALVAVPAAAQDDQASTSQSENKTVQRKVEEAAGPKFTRSLTNVQIELTLSDQIGTQGPEKKTVSMIVSSGNWGKVRSAGTVFRPGDAPYGVELNVDARPFVSMEGPIQLEIALNYVPSTADVPNTIKSRPSGLNQSLTVILQSGKPLTISQAADPVSDRKVVVEVKATVLK